VFPQQGSRIYVTGRLQYGEITDKEGVSGQLWPSAHSLHVDLHAQSMQVRRTSTSIAADDIIYMGKGREQ
jgi:single-stranded DNA-binding protein